MKSAKNPHAQALARLRWGRMSKEHKSQIGLEMARARWTKEKAKEKEKRADISS